MSAVSRTTTFAPASGAIVAARGDGDLQRQPRAGFVTPVVGTTWSCGAVLVRVVAFS